MTGVTDLDGIFKHVYANRVENLIPETDQVAKLIKFVPAEQREGNQFNQPVLLTHEHGGTYNTDGSAFTLNESVSLTTKEAQINGAEFVMRSELSYGAMQRALKKGGKAGARAFVQATQFQVKNLVESMSKRRELSLLYGLGTGTPNTNSGLGTVSAVAGDALSWTLTISDATWSTAIWAGMEGCTLDLYDATAKVNGSGDITVSTVDVANRQIGLTFTVDPAGDGHGDPEVGDELYFEGQYGKDMVGMVEVASNTGTLHNISASTYNLWKGSTFAVGGQLSFGKVLEGLERPSSFGFRGKMCVLVNPAAWQDINEDQAALRRYAGKAGGDLEQGAESLTFYGQTGVVELRPHIYMKRGLAMAFCPEEWMRVGATDITFEMPDGSGRILKQLDSKAGIEFRGYYNQAPFTPKPCNLVLYTGITPTAAAA